MELTTKPSSPIPPWTSMASAGTLPLTSAEIQSIYADLDPHFGHRLVDAKGKSWLLVRVPDDRQDWFALTEEAGRYVSPEKALQADECLLISSRRVTEVPIDGIKAVAGHSMQETRAVLRDLMSQHGGVWRVRTLRHPSDPRRKLRLVVDLPLASLSELEDHQLEEAAGILGPGLRTGEWEAVQIVHLVSATDHTHLSIAELQEELLPRYEAQVQAEEAERDRLTRDAARTADRVARRRRLLDELDETLSKPVERRTSVIERRVRRTETRSTSVESRRRLRTSDEMESWFHRRGDVRLPSVPDVAPKSEYLVRVDEEHEDEGELLVRTHLEALGYDVRHAPSVLSDATIVAERSEYPERVILWQNDEMDARDALRWSKKTKLFGADLAILVMEKVPAEVTAALTGTNALACTLATLPNLPGSGRKAPWTE